MSNRSTLAPTDRASSLAVELRAVIGKLKRRLREESGGADLTPSQISVLLRLEKDGPAAVSTLARAEGMRPQSMSAIVASLQKVGFVSGSPDPNDGRQILIALSRTCRRLLRESRAARQDWLATTIQRKLPSQDQEKLAVAVGLLSRLVEDESPPRRH